MGHVHQSKTKTQDKQVLHQVILGIPMLLLISQCAGRTVNSQQ